MPANVGEMFYYGDVPWHGEGLKLSHPANMEEANQVWRAGLGGGNGSLKTAEDPPSGVDNRVAIVRRDRSKEIRESDRRDP